MATTPNVTHTIEFDETIPLDGGSANDQSVQIGEIPIAGYFQIVNATHNFDLIFSYMNFGGTVSWAMGTANTAPDNDNIIPFSSANPILSFTADGVLGISLVQSAGTIAIFMNLTAALGWGAGMGDSLQVVGNLALRFVGLANFTPSAPPQFIESRAGIFQSNLTVQGTTQFQDNMSVTPAGTLSAQGGFSFLNKVSIPDVGAVTNIDSNGQVVPLVTLPGGQTRYTMFVTTSVAALTGVTLAAGSLGTFVVVQNNGPEAVVLNGASISSGGAREFFYGGSAWIAL